ncbi:hypothetical protein AA313_de0207363 [Arthrobotrys entomopaga]|nr:hypothetical protein AA313_de0207363 [Arthrobotrys entomopaga]
MEPATAVVNALMKAGRNTASQTWAYNDASLKPSRLAQLVQETTQLQMDTKSDPPVTTVTAERTTVILIFNSMPVTQAETGKLVAELTILQDFGKAWLAMRSRVTDQDPSAVPFFIGHCSLQTKKSLLYMRGNVLVELTIQSTTAPTENVMDTLHGIIKRCDTYLARRVVRKSQIRRPVVAFAQDPPINVAENTTFAVTLQDDDSIADVVVASSDQSNLVEPQAFDKQGRSVTFRVLHKADQQPDVARITLVGAHRDTFYPGSKSFTVTVL